MSNKNIEPVRLPITEGSEPKIVVTAELPGGLHLSGIDFKCVFWASKGSVVVDKLSMTREDDDHYLAIVNTDKTGPGDMYIELQMMLPDNDDTDGFRKEVVTAKVVDGYVIQKYGRYNGWGRKN